MLKPKTPWSAGKTFDDFLPVVFMELWAVRDLYAVETS